MISSRIDGRRESLGGENPDQVWIIAVNCRVSVEGEWDWGRAVLGYAKGIMRCTIYHCIAFRIWPFSRISFLPRYDNQGHKITRGCVAHHSGSASYRSLSSILVLIFE